MMCFVLNLHRVLTNELHMQHVSMKQRQEDWMQREASTLTEIDRLKKELELARRETDAVTDLSGTLDVEVSSIETDLAGKKKQMERLINAMKEANLQSLTIQPPGICLLLLLLLLIMKIETEKSLHFF